MNNELTIFKNPEFGEVRTLLINNEPYFVGKDVCEVLGYSNSRKAIKDHVDEEDVTKRDTLTKGGNQEVTFINESGLYSLVFGSKLDSAKKFKRWVTSEVLPAIRKTGSYSTVPQSYSQALRELATKVEQNEKLALENKKKEQIINELKPKADYTDIILKSKELVNTNQIAKDYGMSAIQFNKILHDFNIQYKQNEQWLLYRKYQDKGYTFSETIVIDKVDGTSFIKMNTKWTQKGRLFLYNTLKEKNILPTIEKQ